MLGQRILLNQTYAAAIDSSTVQYRIRGGKPMRGIGFDLRFVAAADVLPQNSPELWVQRITMRGDSKVLMDLTGMEAWNLANYQLLGQAIRNVSATTAPRSAWFLEFGRDSAVVPDDYTDLTLDLTFGTPTLVTAGAITSGNLTVWTEEQQYKPQSGHTRRFLRKEVALVAAGELEVEVPHRTGKIDSLLLIAIDTAQTLITFAKDATDANIGNVRISTHDSRGRTDDFRSSWRAMQAHGLMRAQGHQWDALASTLSDVETRGTCFIPIAETYGGAVDFSGASDLILAPTVVTPATTLVVLSNLLVPNTAA